MGPSPENLEAPDEQPTEGEPVPVEPEGIEVEEVDEPEKEGGKSATEALDEMIEKMEERRAVVRFPFAIHDRVRHVSGHEGVVTALFCGEIGQQQVLVESPDRSCWHPCEALALVEKAEDRELTKSP